jgi:hypothetical protein
MTEKKITSSPMDFEALALFTADHAVVEGEKLYINGGFWDALFLASYPTQVTFSLVAVIKVPARAYLEDHKITIEMVDVDENPLPLRIEGDLRVGAPPHLNPGDPSLVPMAFPLTGSTIERAGEYWFILSVDGKELRRYQIRAVQVITGPTMPSQSSGSNDGEEE